MKIYLTTLFVCMATLTFSQTTIELLQDSCSYLQNYIYLDSNDCTCTFNLVSGDLTFEVTSLTTEEKSMFFNSPLSPDQLDSLSVYYFLFGMDTIKHQSVDIGTLEKPVKNDCHFNLKVSKKYRNFYQIQVSGIKDDWARSVTFNVYISNNKILALSSGQWKSSTVD